MAGQPLASGWPMRFDALGLYSFPATWGDSLGGGPALCFAVGPRVSTRWSLFFRLFRGPPAI